MRHYQPRAPRGVRQGGQWITAERAESTVTLNPWTDAAPADRWGAEGEAVVEPEVASPGPELVAKIGQVSHLRTAAGKPIEYTPYNYDLLGDLTQHDMDYYTEAFYEASATEFDRMATRVSTEDVRLPGNPTPEEIARVAANVDDAFSAVTAPLSNREVPSLLPVLSEVYGTPDRAVVAIGAAVAANADELARGPAKGGAKAVEQAWLTRQARQEERDVAAGHQGARSRETQMIDLGIDSDTLKTSEAMSQAYVEALSQVRPIGGELDLHSRSVKVNAQLVKDTGRYWPSDWVEASNRSNPLYVHRRVSRASYSHKGGLYRGELVSVLRVSGNKVGSYDDRRRAVTHEMGHRMESVVDNITPMVRAWRDRRVAESDEAGRELVAIYRGTNERGYRDSFVDHYVGKVYDDGDTEVFSMGAESLFVGSNGGLIGTSRTKDPDPDMRHMILGVLASAGMAKNKKLST